MAATARAQRKRRDTEAACGPVGRGALGAGDVEMVTRRGGRVRAARPGTPRTRGRLDSGLGKKESKRLANCQEDEERERDSQGRQLRQVEEIRKVSCAPV